MSTTGTSSLCLVLVLAAFLQFGLASAVPVGLVQVYNDAHDMTDLTRTLYKNMSTQTDPVYVPLPQGSTGRDTITDDVACVTTAFRMVIDKQVYGQNVRIWCQHGMVIDCVPNCYWKVDMQGFSVANAPTAPYQFVIGWEGPIPSA